MFQKTKWHLTLVNGAVVGLVLIMISFALYNGMKGIISNQTDQKIEEQMKDVKEAILEKTLMVKRDFPIDPRSITVLWFDDNTVATIPDKQIFIEDLAELSKLSYGYSDYKVGNYHYRVLTESYPLANLQHVQILWTVNSEKEQLQMLKIILIYGTIVGVLLSIFIGRYLTQYALVPIRKSWEQQERFVGDASHELRTPLAVIQNQAESLLQNPDETIYEHSDTISKILRESQKMKRLLSDLLLLAKSDSNELILHKKTFTISELLEDITMYFEDIAELQEISFSVRKKYEGEMDADLEKIQQVLIILLDNAFKYKKEPAEISLECRAVNNKVIFIVKDNGIGIEKEHVPFIFDRFYRVEKSRSRQGQGGHGLGLSIAKWIVEAHHGTIEVNSEINKGTEFVLTFPKTRR